MSYNVKNKLVNEQTLGANFRYYKFLSYETFTDNKTGKIVKFQKNAKLAYTLVANQFARLLKTGHFIKDEHNTKFIRLNTKELAATSNITEQTLNTKLKFLESINLLIIKDNLVSVPFPKVNSPKSTFVDKNGNTKLTYSVIPKYLVEHSYYKDLTENSIIYYSLTRERFVQSCQNNKVGTKKYVDVHGNDCCWFTNEEATELLGVSEGTLKKDRDLLFVKGLLKSSKKNKALTYRVFEPIALPVENEETEVNSEDVADENLASLDENLDPSNEKLGLENLKVAVEEFEKLGLSNTYFSNTSNINTLSNDMYVMSTNNKESIENTTTHTIQSNNESSVIEYEKFKKQQLVKYLPEFLGSYLTNFELDEIVLIKDNLFMAKKSYHNDLDIITTTGALVEREEQVEFSVEDLATELQSVFKRIHGKRTKDNESIKDLAATGFLFTCIKNVFIQAYSDFYEDNTLFASRLSFGKRVQRVSSDLQSKRQYTNQHVNGATSQTKEVIPKFNWLEA